VISDDCINRRLIHVFGGMKNELFKPIREGSGLHCIYHTVKSCGFEPHSNSEYFLGRGITSEFARDLFNKDLWGA